MTGFRNWIVIRTGVAGAEGKGSQGGLLLPSSLGICISPALLSGGLCHLAATQGPVILGFSDPGERDPFCPITHSKSLGFSDGPSAGHLADLSAQSL